MADVKPSRPSTEVVSVTNAAAAELASEVVLLLRVGERLRAGLDPLTLVLTASEPRLRPLAEGCRGEDMVSFAYWDSTSEPARVVDVFLARTLTGVDVSDPRRVRLHHPTSGFGTAAHDVSDFPSERSHLRVVRRRDGVHFAVDEEPSVVQEDQFDEYGCEDSRATLIDGAWHITCVSVGRSGITTSRLTTTDFASFERKDVMFLRDHKDVALFPDLVGGRYAALTRAMPQSFGGSRDIWIVFFDDLVSWGNHQPLEFPRSGMWDELRIGAGCVPFRVPGGWLEIYHGVNRDGRYALGGLLLDGDDHHRVIARSPDPILVPIDSYETSGLTKNSAYSCGHVALDPDNGSLRAFDGAAGSSLAAADFRVRDIVDQVQAC